MRVTKLLTSRLGYSCLERSMVALLAPLGHKDSIVCAHHGRLPTKTSSQVATQAAANKERNRFLLVLKAWVV